MSDNPIVESEVSEELELEGQTNDSDVNEAEELETEVETSPETEIEGGEESLVYELDGEEIALETIREWREGGMKEKDYRQKTMKLADERKAAELEREKLTQAQNELKEMRDHLQVLVNEDSEVDWNQLKVDDPDEYIRLKELQEKRADALQKLKTQTDDPVDIQVEQQKLFQANPDWVSDGKVTEQYQKDIAMMNDYAHKSGFSAEEFSRMTKAHYLTTVLKAAKWDALQDKTSKVKEQRVNAPKVIKPKAKVVSKPTTRAERFYGNN